MRTFLHGWRRKAGVATLVVALAVFGMWTRSLYFTDICCANLFGDYHVIQSRHGIAVWLRQIGIGVIADVTDSYGKIDHYRPEYRYSKWNEAWEPDEVWRCDWQYRLGEAGAGCHEQMDDGKLRTLWWRIAYWELVVPLTLLSAYLILWKPRKRSSPN